MSVAFGHSILYQGYHLRSRVEFAWAQYFEGEGLEWEYETKVSRNGKLSYTPDFILAGGVICEIKSYGARNVGNHFELCPLPLLLIFGLPTNHYIRFKPALAERFTPGHIRAFRSAYDLARKVAA